MANSAGIHMVEQTRRFRSDIEHRNTILVFGQAGSHGHLSIWMESEALNSRSSVLDHAGDCRFPQRQIDDRNIAQRWDQASILTHERHFTVQADSQDVGGGG